MTDHIDITVCIKYNWEYRSSIKQNRKTKTNHPKTTLARVAREGCHSNERVATVTSSPDRKKVLGTVMLFDLRTHQ